MNKLPRNITIEIDNHEWFFFVKLRRKLIDKGEHELAGQLTQWLDDTYKRSRKHFYYENGREEIDEGG